MRKCPYCGLENGDEAVECLTCHTALMPPPASSPPEPKAEYRISAGERRLWERMTFREFALLFLRIQALWLLFNAVVDVTYLPRYVSRWAQALSHTASSVELGRELFWLIFRIVLHVAAALALIQYGERLLSWLVKDWVAKGTLNPSSAPPAAGGGPQDSSNSMGSGSRDSV